MDFIPAICDVLKDFFQIVFCPFLAGKGQLELDNETIKNHERLLKKADDSLCNSSNAIYSKPEFWSEEGKTQVHNL